jgi:hypothetical protein
MDRELHEAFRLVRAKLEEVTGAKDDEGAD